MAAQNKNTSNFEDIISKSTQISSGPPAVYKLRTEKEKFGPVSRVTVGEKDETKTNKTILLVGETGAGKSTLINALFNHTIGVKFEDKVWFQVVEEKGQTSDVIVYQIFESEDQTLPYSLTIIDTPGFGSTRGMEHDVNTNQQLLELFQSREGVHELHAVGLVMKESENQLSDRLKYIFDSLMSLFGKNLEKSICALITHSSGRPTKNVLQALQSENIKCAKNEKNQPVHFLFDNCQDEARTEETETFIENSWRVRQKEMEKFIAYLDKSSPLQLEAMLEEQREQIRLTACIQNLKDRIRFTELKQRDIREAQEALCKYESDQMFPVDIPEVHKYLERITNLMCKLGFEAAICCLECQENCHYPGCTKALTPQQCEVMREGKCTSCTRKCFASAHVKQNWKYVIRTKEDQKTKKEIQQKHNKNQTFSLKKLSLSQRLENEMKHLTEEKSQLVDEAYQHFIKLEQITQSEDSVSAYVHLDFLMKKMKDKGDLGRLRELQKMDSRMDERTRAELQHRMESVSTKHEDLISASVLIQSEPPAVYQLRTKKKMFGTLSRVTVGEKDETKTNKTILLVGETGAGKSTEINVLFNHTMGVKFEDEVWFQVVEEEEKNSQTESQTSDVIVYQIFGFEGQTLPYSLTIIDTRGFGSTRGSQEDVRVSQRLFDLFRSEEGVHEIHAVGLVIKASMNRVNERLKYIFDSVMSLFGKDLEKNIVALITHSDGETPENVLQALKAAGIKCAKDEKNQPVYFLFDNQQKTQRGSTDKNKTGSKYSWDFTNEEMGRLTDFLQNSNSQPLITTVEVLNNRIQLTACIQNLQERIELIELKQTEIKQIQEVLKKHEEEMKKNEKFTEEIDEVYKDKEVIEGGMWWLLFFEAAVTCSICEENCHYPGCTMAWKPSHCEVMSWGRCTVCTNKCPASDHVKENWIYVTKTRKKKITLDDVKQKYEKSRAEHENKSSLLENLEEETRNLTTEKSQLLDEAYQHVIRLEQIALKVNSLSTSAHLDFLIEKMKENGDTEKVQILEVLKSRMS